MNFLKFVKIVKSDENLRNYFHEFFLENSTRIGKITHAEFKKSLSALLRLQSNYLAKYYETKKNCIFY